MLVAANILEKEENQKSMKKTELPAAPFHQHICFNTYNSPTARILYGMGLLILSGVSAAGYTRQKSPHHKIAGKIKACKSCAANCHRHMKLLNPFRIQFWRKSLRSDHAFARWFPSSRDFHHKRFYFDCQDFLTLFRF